MLEPWAGAASRSLGTKSLWAARLQGRPGCFWQRLSPGEGGSCVYTGNSWVKASQLCFCSALAMGETCLPLAFQNTN